MFDSSSGRRAGKTKRGKYRYHQYQVAELCNISVQQLYNFCKKHNLDVGQLSDVIKIVRYYQNKNSSL